MPTAASPAAVYTITASNSAGSATATVSITVNSGTAAPSGLTYATNPAVYAVGAAIPPNIPSSGGGAVTSYSVSPALPDGLSLDKASGIITGTPTVACATAVYTITASNSAGSTTAAVSITVNSAATVPTALTYSTNPAVYAVGTAIPPNTPSSSGGAVSSYSISPALPAGLSLNSTTGILSGTPTAVAATAVYTITASNSAGSTTAAVSITVNAAVKAPSGLMYLTDPVVYAVGTAIPANTPSSDGGAVSSYSVSPALPNGLSLNSATGVISGTPTAAAAIADYTVTAANSAGSTTAALSITVNPEVTAPLGLTYLSNSAVYAVGSAIAPNVPNSVGGVAVGYTVTPALPDGLSLNSSTGVISGTAISAVDNSSYTVTASNSAGSATTAVTIAVNNYVTAPSELAYPSNPVIYAVGTTIPANIPTSRGGAVDSYSVSPALPDGLDLNSTTGIISGTPTVAATSAAYTVTASNSAGRTTASISITVNPAVPAPSWLAYSINPAVYAVGTVISPDTPTGSGGAATAYSVAPTLPAGLSLNSSVGVISGVPAVAVTNTSYTITASNSAGSTSAAVSITVNPAVTAPTGLTYSTNTAVYVVGTTIIPNVPTSSGGTVTAYSMAPVLPAGLILDGATGIISGTPTAASPAAVYTVTASNSAGSTSAAVSITVNPAVTAPSGLTYSTNPAVYTVGTAISPDTPKSSGGTISSYSVAPALPAGLSLNGTTGIISGTPTAATAIAVYTVTASNSAGSASAAVSITVNPPPAPNISSFTANPTSFTLGGTSPVKLTALFSNGTGVISPGNIAIQSGSSASVYPTTTTTYTLTVKNAVGNSATATATVSANLSGTYQYNLYGPDPIDAHFGFYSTGVGNFMWERHFSTGQYDSWLGTFTYTISGSQIDLYWTAGDRSGTHSSVQINDANNLYFEGSVYTK